MQTTLPFLHRPSRDATEIANYVATNKEETETLDFKMKVEGTFDLAKDLAAFANNQGGDLVIGVTDQNDRASGWHFISDSDLQAVHQQITQALDCLRPVDFKLSVRFDPPVRFAVDQNVFVISVPPSPDLLGVQRGSATFRLSAQVPREGW